MKPEDFLRASLFFCYLSAERFAADTKIYFGYRRGKGRLLCKLDDCSMSRYGALYKQGRNDFDIFIDRHVDDSF